MFRIKSGQSAGSGIFISGAFSVLLLVVLMLIPYTASASVGSEEAMMCLGCHSIEGLTKTLDNGEEVSLFVDEKHFKDTVHSFLSCTGCHMDVSMDAHPSGRRYESRIKFALALSSACEMCHPGSSEAYRESIHGLAEENREVPAACSSCHFAHGVKPALASMTNTEACIRCHERTADPDKWIPYEGLQILLGLHGPALFEAHSSWLPNAGIHLKTVACAACHVPGADRALYLHITNSSGQVIHESRVKEILGASYKELTDAGEKGIGSSELWNIYWKMKAKTDTVFTAKLGLKDKTEAHGLTSKNQAVNQCQQCHRAGPEFFKTVALTVITDEGREKFYTANPEVLSSLSSVLSVGRFYAMGSTRVKLLDFLGILMILGGASFPALHITVRILTRRLRQRR